MPYPLTLTYAQRVAALLLVLGCIAFAPHAQGQDAHTTTPTIRAALSAAPRILDPRFATDATAFRMLQLMYQAPVLFDDASNPIPWLTTWQVLDDGARYRLTIQDAAAFSDGAPVTSADIAATYNAVLDPEIGSPHRASLAKHIKHITIVDTKTLDITLKNPDPLFPGQLVIGVLKAEHARDKTLTTHIGSGAFRLDAHSDHAWRLTHRARGFHLHFVLRKDATVRALQLMNEELDWAQDGFDVEIANRLDAEPHLQTLRVPSTTFAYLGMNLADPVLMNADIRQALAMSIDRTRIIATFLGGSASPANTLLTPEHWAAATLADIPYDVKAAKTLLARHGYTADNPLRLSYKTSKSRARLRLATALQAMLAPANMAITIQSYDWGTFYDDIKAGRFQLFSLAWVGIKQPDIYHYVFHSSMTPPNGANRGRYQNDAVDTALDSAATAANLADKTRHYQTVQRLLHKDLPYVPLWHMHQTVILSDAIAHFPLARDGNWLGFDTVQFKPPSNR